MQNLHHHFQYQALPWTNRSEWNYQSLVTNNLNPAKPLMKTSRPQTKSEKNFISTNTNHEEPSIDLTQENCDSASTGFFKTQVIKQTTLLIGSFLCYWSTAVRTFPGVTIGTIKLKLSQCNLFKLSSKIICYLPFRDSASFVDLLCYLRFVFVILSCLFIAALWPPAGKGFLPLGSLICDVFLCFFLFPCGVLGQVWYLIVSTPDFCFLTYFGKL